MKSQHLAPILAGGLIIGALCRFYGLTQPWGVKDHYNFGGPFTSSHVFCISHSHWSQSRGVPFLGCAAENDLTLSPLWDTLSEEQKARALALHKPVAASSPQFYANHPPLYPDLLSLWTRIAGEKEWAFRLFTIFFSLANIAMVYRIAEIALGAGLPALLAAFFQAGFLGGMYFGSHVDYPGEFTTFFLLCTSLLALRGRWAWASAFGILAGLSDWPGFFVFVPLLLSAWASGQGVRRVLAGGALGVGVGLATTAYLQNTWDLLSFLQTRLSAKDYTRAADSSIIARVTLPLRFVLNLVSTYSRFLSPLFAAFGFTELLFGEARAIFRPSFYRNRALSPFHHAVLLTGGTMAITALAGMKYVMVHSFWYMLGLPCFALLCARFTLRLLDGSLDVKLRRGLIGALLVTTAFYPYGVYKSNQALDLFNGLSFIAVSLAFVFWAKSECKRIAALGAACVALNFSQTVNYRGEKLDSRAFCRDLLVRYIEKGERVRASRPPTLAEKDLYCRGIPIDWP